MPAASSKTKMVVLKLNSDHLSKFPSDSESSTKSTTSQPNSSPPSSSANNNNNNAVAQIIEPSPSDTPTDPNAAPSANGTSTPSNPNSLAPPAAAAAAPPPKKRGIPGPKPGTKRGANNLTPEGLPKPRGKPGPKKKPRIGELKNDPLAKGAFAAPAPIQKLGPKANQGAINAGLRALDRTGKPCRKWEKKGFAIKSFTGVVWDVPTWRAPKRSTVDANGDVKSDTPSSSDAKVKEESSAVSEKSNGADSATPIPPVVNGIASSPAPVAAAS